MSSYAGSAATSLHEGFQDTRQVDEIADLFRWLDIADGLEPIKQIKRLMLDVRPPEDGDRILDVGCGIGHEVQRLATRVGRRGRVVGIDKSESMIAEARRRGSDPSLSIEYKVGDARLLELADGTVDLCRAERVLRYVERPEQALQEMVRVLRPGGHVVVFDLDSDQTIVDAPDMSLVRRIAEVLDRAVPNPWMARQLFRLFKQVGLTEVRVVPQVTVATSPNYFPVYRRLVAGSLDRAAEVGQIDASDLARWWELLERADRDGVFFTVMLGAVVSGRKP
ncbi:MAG TPA: methyltransferase domain-containing protein [Kofleriaceae bacterium]|nr:methyltransferase domain-containing protein [Kofleriaceae bacterium]